jgi:hypothetical protein
MKGEGREDRPRHAAQPRHLLRIDETTSPKKTSACACTSASPALACTVTANLAQHDDLRAPRNVGCDLSIASNGDAVTREIDRTLYLAIYVE